MNPLDSTPTTLAEAWRWLAAFLERSQAVYGENLSYNEDGYQSNGLCMHIGIRGCFGVIHPRRPFSAELAVRMMKQIGELQVEEQALRQLPWPATFLFRYDDIDSRVILCYFLALEAEQEAAC